MAPPVSLRPTRTQIEAVLAKKCCRDQEFQQQIVKNPKAVIERHLGRLLPAQVGIFIHEEDASTLHLTIPARLRNVNEVSDEELERVAGGTDFLVVATIANVVTAVVAGSVSATVTASW